MADLGGVLALGGAPRRHVRLERHLDEHCAADARDLAQQRGRIGHVLEHVREHAEVVAAVALRQVLPVVARDGVDLRALARDRDGGVADLDARQSCPPKPRSWSSQSSAPSPQPTSSVRAGRTPA